ncbi:protein Lilipod [Toxorhynchites rutilus septentrionalis]|uniref:protein Lilipod n=1 Tax=Toxorhynchites rutilus septentrionalis TaxID=329112 RepID=UPI002478A020|nr:protein Lilipod [Toxorhynchites rutilus septentrionalis]
MFLDSPPLITEMDEEEDIADIREQIFHNTVREHIIFLLLFLLLYLGSFALIGRFRRRDREDLFSTDDDEVTVYRISLWLCTFSLAVAVGAALLLPISIASNEVLILYPNSYYVKWLNSSLIQGLWNHVFLFSNLALFVLLPFSYLFTESSGFIGHKKGVMARVYETFTVFSMLAFIVFVMTYLVSALREPDRNTFQALFNLGKYHLPFLYSCVSFLGVILLLVCTPMGFVRLFGVVGQVLVKPNLLRDVNEEFHAFNLEEASVRRRLANANLNIELRSVTTIDQSPSKLCAGLEDMYQLRATNNGTVAECTKLFERLRELEADRKSLDKQRSSSALQRNLVYPLAMLLLLLLTGVTVLLVVQNTLELLIGIKAVPLSTRQFTLGITSLSKLGPLGAALEVCVIMYLGVTSAVGLYTMPFMRNVRPVRRKTSLSQVIANCALVLILSSALPLLSRILGITNFDLLGDFGQIEWLGNFMIVLLYNVIFGTAATLCLVNKFTATVRRELCARLKALFDYSSHLESNMYHNTQSHSSQTNQHQHLESHNTENAETSDAHITHRLNHAVETETNGNAVTKPGVLATSNGTESKKML